MLTCQAEVLTSTNEIEKRDAEGLKIDDSG